MDYQFIAAKNSITSTNIGIYSEEGNLRLLAIVYPHLEYKQDDYFPCRVHLDVERVDTTLIGDQGRPMYGHGEGRLEVGMNSRLPLTIHLPHEGVADEFSIRISEVSEDGKKAVAEIDRPLNVPICSYRWTVKTNFNYEQKANNYSLNPPLWPFLKTIVGLDIPSDIQLDENTRIIKLTQADAIEMKHYLSSTYRNHPLIFNPLTHAVCFLERPQDVQQEFKRVLLALRLFNPGYVEYGLDFQFDASQSSHSLQDKPPYRHPYPKFILTKDETLLLQDWWNDYKSITISQNSVMDRALSRFERTYSGNPHERTTDAVISMETLLMPGRSGEINYRVAQRAGFLVSDDPGERITTAHKVKKAYGVRSGMVHENAESSSVTEDSADECRELLRCCIKRIMCLDSDLRDEFCQVRKNTDVIHTFYDALISFGNDEGALTYWRESKTPIHKEAI